jgi:putative addiction module component (TIGR02574 family)
MSTPVFNVESEALKLPPEARARLLEKLMSNLQPTPPAKKAWVEAALRRREEVDSGKVQMVSGEGVVERIRAKYS